VGRFSQPPLSLKADFAGFPEPEQPRLAYMVSDELQFEMRFDPGEEAIKVAEGMPKCTEEQRLHMALWLHFVCK
jgi:hypothetical protein